MRTRRRILEAFALVGSVGLAGCDGLGTERSETAETGAPVTATANEPTGGLETEAGSETERDEDESAMDVVVENVSGEARYVTVVVLDGGRELFVESASYAPDGTDQRRRYAGVVSDPGEYEVVVETGDGARARETVRTDGVRGDVDGERPSGRRGSLGDVAVTVGEELRVRQRVRCSPECEPVSVGGEFERFDTHAWPARPASAGYAVGVTNVGDEAREVRVAFDVGERRVLDYRYRPGPGEELRFPVVPPLKRFVLTVETAGETWRAEWDGARSVAIPLAFDGDGVRVDAWPSAGADLTVRNERARREVTVEARREGELVAAGTFDLRREETAAVEEFLGGPGVYDVRVSADDVDAAATRTFVVARRGRILVRARDGVDAYLVR